MPFIPARQPCMKKEEGMDMGMKKESFKSSPVWISLINVPLVLWTTLGLSWLASQVGRPLCLDQRTSRLNHLHAARICVEVDRDAILPDKIMVSLGPEFSHSTVEVEFGAEPDWYAVWQCPAGCATEAFWTLYAADLVILGMLGFSGSSQVLDCSHASICPIEAVTGCCIDVAAGWSFAGLNCVMAYSSFAWVRLRPNCRSGFKSWFGFEMNCRSRIASHMPISFVVASDFPVLDLSCRSQNRDRFWATCRILLRMGAGFGCQPGSVSQHILMMVLI
ncbi:hypothetical protein Nepgr_014715 [Nepenthes gracilis]|uniref:Uncharacterized protein n=1 Tax=Nepenthes gracilis TaxID=150966 RepID=A0AAD3SLI2_NEPGR|nr:hypothetical protein Nepgr_014715 [Nepenthes gracilis]